MTVTHGRVACEPFVCGKGERAKAVECALNPLVQSVEYSRAVRTVRIPPCGPDGTSIARASNVPGIEDTDDMDDIGDPDMIARSESTKTTRV